MADRLPGQPGFLLSGGAPPPEEEDASTRSFPRAAIDFGLGVARIIPETYQTAVEGGRTLFGGDQPGGWWQRRAKEAGDVMDWYKGLSSEREHQVEEKKFFPGADDQSAWSDLPAVAAHHIAGLVPYLFGGRIAKAVIESPATAAKAAKYFNIGAMGTQQYGAYNQALRDYFEKTSLDQLNASVPGFSEMASQIGDEAARNEAYKKAWSPIAAVLNAGVGAVGGAGISHAVGGMGMKLLPRTAVGTAEGLGIGASMGAASEYGRQQGLVNVGAQGAIDTEKMYRAAGESALPMGAIVGTAHAWTGKYDPKKAEDTGKGGGVSAEHRVALGEEFPQTYPQPTGFGTPGEAWRGPAGRAGVVGDQGPLQPAVEPPAGPPGSPAPADRGRTQPFVGEPPLSPDLPGVTPRTALSTPYGGEAPLPTDIPGRPARRFERVQRNVPEGAEPYLPEPTGPRQPIRDEYPRPTGLTATEHLPGEPPGLDTETGLPVPGRAPSAEGFRGGTRPRPIGPGPTTGVGFPPPPPPGTQLVRGPGPPRSDLPGRPPAAPLQPPQLTYQGRTATLPSGAPSIMTPSARTLAEYEQTLQQPPKRPPGGGGGGGTPPAVARERARAAPKTEAPAGPKVEKGPLARTLKPGDTIIDTNGDRLVVEDNSSGHITIKGIDGAVPHADVGVITVERAAAPAAEAKPAAAKEAPAKPVETKPVETKPAETKPAEAKPAEAKPAAAKSEAPAKEPTAADHIRDVIGHAALYDSTTRDKWATRLRNIAFAKKRLEYSDLPAELKAVLTDSPLLRSLMDDPVSFDRLVSGAGHMEVPELPAGLRREPQPQGAARVAEVSKRRTTEAKGEEKPKAEEPKKEVTGPVTEEETRVKAAADAKALEDAVQPDWVPPSKPKDFDSAEAKAVRAALDLPQSWEALIERVKGPEMVRFLEIHAREMLDQPKGGAAVTEQGKIRLGRDATTFKRRRRKTEERELVVEDSLEEGWEGENKRELLAAAMGRSVSERRPPLVGPIRGRPFTEVPSSVSIRGVETPTITRTPGQPTKAQRRLLTESAPPKLDADGKPISAGWTAVLKRPRAATEKPPIEETAARALDVMEKQIAAWVKNLTEYLNDEALSGRQKDYVHGKSPADEIFFVPKPEEPRSGGVASSYWSRLVMVNAKRKLFTDLLNDWEAATSNKQRTALEHRLKKQLWHWGRDETVGPIVAHGERRTSTARRIEEYAQPRVVTERGTFFGLEALEHGANVRIVDDAGMPMSPDAAAEQGGILQGITPAMPLDAADVGIWTQNKDKMTKSAILARLYLDDFDVENARRLREGQPTLTKEELKGFLRLSPRERLTMDRLKQRDPDLHDALLEASQRPVPVYDPETGGQKLIVKTWDPEEGTWHDSAAPDQNVRDSLLAAEKQRQTAGQEAKGIGTLGEAMIRAGAASEETAARLIADPVTTSVEWARENSLQLGEQLNDILRNTAAHLNGWASDLRRITGFEPDRSAPRHLTEAEMEARAAEGYQRTEPEGFMKLELGEKQPATVGSEARRRAAEQAAEPVEPQRERYGTPTVAAHLEEVATLLNDLAPNAYHYERRLPAISALRRMVDDPQVSMHLSEDLAVRITSWLERYHNADLTLAAIERLTPGRLSTLRAEAPIEGRGEPVLTPISSGIGLAPSDVRARVTAPRGEGGRQTNRPYPRPEIGAETTVEERPTQEDTFVELPHTGTIILSAQQLAENAAARAARTGIYALEPGTEFHKITSGELRGRADVVRPPKETVVLPTRPSLAEFERRRGEPGGEERLAEHQSVVDRVVNYLFERKKPARYPEEITDDEYVKSSPVKDLSHEIYDRNDPIDIELKKVADQTVGDVKVMVLHPDIFTSLMKRLGQSDNAGYYDWRTDTIYLNKDKSDVRTIVDAEAWNTLMRHEVGHAMTFGAVETNPQAKRAIKQLTDILAKRPRAWLSELEKMKGTDFGSPYFQEGKTVPYTLESIKRILSDPHEFLAHIQGNKDFRRIISAAQLSGAERTQLRTPQARTIFEAAKQWIYRAVKDLFKRSKANDALTDALAMTFEILEGTVESGRPKFDPRRKNLQTGAAGFWDSALGEKLGETGREIKFRYKKQGATWGQKAFWSHTLEDLTRWGNEAFKGKTVPIREHISEMYTMAHNYARERGDETLLHALAKMQSSPNADRFADFALRRSKNQSYTEAPLFETDANGKPTGMNVHIRKGMLHRQVERVHNNMRAEHDEIMRDIPYAKDLLKMMDDWGTKVARDDALAVIHDTAGMDNITRDKDGNIDALAQSAFEKYVVNHKDTPLTTAEKAWIDSKRPDPHDYTDAKARQDAYLKRINFDKLVASYRDNPDLARRAGPWVPFKRFGDHAISGDYIFPIVDRNDGRHIDRGIFEFYGDDPANAFIDRVTDTSGVKMLDTDRVVYVRDPSKPREEWVEAKKEDERSQWEGGNVDEPGYVVTTRQGTRRVTPKEAENDPDLEIRRRVNFNDRHVEFFRKPREAQERLDAMTNPASPNYNPHVKMRGEVELVSDYGGSQSPHYMSRAMRGLMDNVRNSWEYKRMTVAERRAWEQRLMTAAAKQVMMAGGRAPGLMREYVEGMSKDLLETYAMASAQSAFNHAHYTYGQRIRDSFKALEEHNFQHKDSAGSSDRRAVSEELERRAYAVNDPFVHGVWGTATNRLLQFTYTAKLAGTSFLGLNAMEPSLIHLPMLAAKVGPWQAFRLYKGAYSDLAGRKIIGKGIADFKKAALNRDGKWSDYQETFSQNLRDSGAADAEDAIRMFDILLKRGMFDRSSVNEVTVLRAAKPTWAGKVLDWADNAFRGLNTGVEALNRGVIALSEFRAAKGTFEERVRAAENAVYKGAGVYAAWNAPPVFNHPVGRMTFQFKKYPQRIISNHIAALMAGLNGETPEIRAQGFKTLGYMLGTTAMVAGMIGLPTEVFSIPFNALSILGLGPSWNQITAEAYGMMANQLGPEAAEVLMHGAPRLFNVDLSGRAGQNNLLFFDQPQSNKPQDLKASIASFFMGAGGSSMMNGVDGIQNTAKALSEAASGSSQRANDYAMRAMRDLMFVKVGVDILDAIRKSGMMGGMHSPGGAALGPELTAGETAMRVLGVQSGREARYWEGRQVEQRREKASQESRTMWVQRMATAEPAERPRIQMAINEWNQTHGLADQVKPSEITKAISRRRTEEARPRSELAMPKNKRYDTERQDISRIYNLQGM